MSCRFYGSCIVYEFNRFGAVRCLRIRKKYFVIEYFSSKREVNLGDIQCKILNKMAPLPENFRISKMQILYEKQNKPLHLKLHRYFKICMKNLLRNYFCANFHKSANKITHFPTCICEIFKNMTHVKLLTYENMSFHANEIYFFENPRLASASSLFSIQ